MPRDVFISYSQSDREYALELTARLEAEGIGVWIAPRDVSPAADWAVEIIEALSGARVMVLLLSASSNVSPQVRREVERAVHKQLRILPVRIEQVLPSVGLEYFLSTQQWFDAFPPPRESHFARLCSHLKSLLSQEGTTATAAVTAPAAASASPSAPSPASASQPTTTPARQRAGTVPLERSIAVLPFANLSSDPEQEYFSDGLTEELINQLAHIKGLRVVARTSCFVFKGRHEDLRLVGEKLAVGRVVEGSVRKAGKRLRITAQLIDCADGYHLWSQTFDRELEDVFAIQDDIARAVAGALGSVLTTDSPATAGGTQNVEAYELYLRARALLGRFTPAAIERSATLYREALALDPRFALACTGLAQAMYWAMLYVPETARQAEAQMDESIERALALAPDLWASHVVICQRAIYHHHWQAADEAARRALALAPPSDTDSLVEIGRWLQSVGRATEALVHLRAACAIDPLSGTHSARLQIVLTILGRDAEADAEYRRGEDLVGNRHVAEHTALLRAWGRSAPPATLREHLRHYQDPVQMPVELELPGLIEHPERARQRLRHVFDDPAYQDSTRLFRLALWAALFGDVDLALAVLRRAYVDLHGPAWYLIWLPIYRSVRADPGFKQLLRDLGLVDYWRASGNWGEFARPIGAEDFEVV